jgi:hypothetical protein
MKIVMDEKGGQGMKKGNIYEINKDNENCTILQRD